MISLTHQVSQFNSHNINSQRGADSMHTNQEPKQIENCENFQKFLSLPEEKRERVINAAMKEFLVGYKKASTDNIVREAGISKGLLFHYFGTKERLYNFLIDYSIAIMQREFVSLVNVVQTDILESVWQLSLLKQDLSVKFPDIFDFITSVYVDTSAKNESTVDNLAKFKAIQSKAITDIYAHADYSLFREDVDPGMVIKVITWTLQGYAQSKTSGAPGQSLGATARENYEQYLEEFQAILDILKKCFYK